MKRIMTAVALFSVVVTMTGCDLDTNKGDTQEQEQRLTESQQEILMRAVPVPRLQTSQERQNLVRRLETFNEENKVSYIYLVDFGKVMAFYTVKGKVSSVNSLLTTPDQVKTFERSEGGDHSVVISSPDLDGSYGSNGNAIFFFTTDGTYVEWSGRYMLCDKPLKLSTPPQMVINVDE